MKNRSLPPLGWFRAFESAARLLSFTAAADELGLTQSAVSQQIRALEDRFGCALFIRKHRAIALTDDGRRLLPGVTDGITNLRAAAEAFEPAAHPEVLTIVTSVSVAQWFLAPLLKGFLSQNEGIKVRVVTAVWPDEFMASTADVRIRYCPVDSAGKKSKPLGSNRIGLFAAPSLIADNTQIGPDQQSHAAAFDEYPLIQPVGTADTWTRFADYANLNANKPISTFVDSHGLAVDFAQSGTGMALTSTLISAPCVSMGKLKLLHSSLMPAKDGYFIDTANGIEDKVANNFVAWLIHEAEQAELAAYQAV
ncbi:LysR family transcriptional regulator [Granulosicoccus sp.]|jgi:LysR family glycine cleavage system transcriptional activator|nr:LysR family transcriptional regulator [Granulosicoccus sp.]MDB4222201.1 LysR family transcriptional regulator [Granulosicoccus sp.]